MIALLRLIIAVLDRLLICTLMIASTNVSRGYGGLGGSFVGVKVIGELVVEPRFTS